MKAFTVCLLLLTIFFKAQAADLLISDVDDTIKTSHVLDFWNAVGNAFETDLPFYGMSDALTMIQEQNPQMKVVYVSNAPELIMGLSHQEFLRKNSFPKGLLLMRTEASADQNKYILIENLIKKENPNRVIFLGDNGEKDIFVYDWFRSHYPKIQFVTFIHVVYSKNDEYETGKELLAEQEPFVTAVEILVRLAEKKLLSSTEVETKVLQLVPQMESIDSENTLGLPEWVNCSDFKSTMTEPYLRYYQNLIADRCRP